jgi:hypothetical protein
MRRRSPLNQTLPRIATSAQKAAGFVTCPLCHMAEATMPDGAVEKAAAGGAHDAVSDGTPHAWRQSVLMPHGWRSMTRDL